MIVRKCLPLGTVRGDCEKVNSHMAYNLDASHYTSNTKLMMTMKGNIDQVIGQYSVLRHVHE